MSMSWLWLALLATMVGVFLAWIAASARRPLRTKRPALPSCGQCGYIVRGIGSLNCPECGADLREVGIVVERPRNRRFRLVQFLVLWTLVMPLPAICISAVVAAAWPRQYSSTTTLGFKSIAGSWQMLDVELEHRTTAQYRGATAITTSAINAGSSHQSTVHVATAQPAYLHAITATVHPNTAVGVSAQPLTIHVDPQTLAFHYTTPTGTVRCHPFDAAAAEAWLIAAGVAFSAMHLHEQAAELSSLIIGLAGGQMHFVFGYISGASSGSSTAMLSSPRVGRMLIFLWGMIYIGGIVLYVFAGRKRRAVQTAGAPDPSP